MFGDPESLIFQHKIEKQIIYNFFNDGCEIMYLTKDYLCLKNLSENQLHLFKCENLEFIKTINYMDLMHSGIYNNMMVFLTHNDNVRNLN